jgi:hypothetical protein
MVKGEINQWLHDEVAALPATLLHLEQLPVLLDSSRKRHLKNG